ncbi:hypothetical protein COCON_G00117860 [Conger conger]|uniref:Uncharacterized protein n=1 Tax=Conger conger TaxID=82655 RepID=A0A9Q1DGD8_CONCO|nr:hypothetical protein COCON_G00117860 [Conger conger]
MKRCSGGKGEKLLNKRRANRTTARKNSQHTRNLMHLTWSVCTGRSSSVLQTAMSLSQSSESESSALPLPSWPAVKDPRSSSPEP